MAEGFADTLSSAGRNRILCLQSTNLLDQVALNINFRWGLKFLLPAYLSLLHWHVKIPSCPLQCPEDAVTAGGEGGAWLITPTPDLPQSPHPNILVTSPPHTYLMGRGESGSLGLNTGFITASWPLVKSPNFFGPQFLYILSNYRWTANSINKER